MIYKMLGAAIVSTGLLAGFGAGAADHQAPAAHGQAAKAAVKSRVFGDGTAVAAKDSTSHGAAGHGKQGAHWTYSGAGGPARWGTLSPKFAACEKGRMQSPIDLRPALTMGVSRLEFDYRLSALAIRNNGHTVQVDYAPGSSMTVNGKTYSLLQFHFHTPSEHLVNGRRFPLEMHLVHKAADGELAVVGVMIGTGRSNLGFQEIWPYLPARAGEARKGRNVAINVRDLLPPTDGYHHYKGSLTTPPCSEGVRWFVLDTPAEADAGQIAAISRIMGRNARPAQPVNDRLVISGR